VFPTILALALVGGAACHHNPPVAKPTTPPTATPAAFPDANRPAPPTTPVEPPPVPVDPTVSAAPIDPNVSGDVETINKSGILKPVFFAYDSDELDDAARQALNENAQVLKKYGTWVVTIEGHCDERGTAEYNLALGERRSLAAKSYLLSLGIGADRLRTVSYGKEFPFDPGHDEGAYHQNRRAQLMLTAKQ
jgi:peptidoglycan-associated lipoprotein